MNISHFSHANISRNCNIPFFVYTAEYYEFCKWEDTRECQVQIFNLVTLWSAFSPWLLPMCDVVSNDCVSGNSSLATTGLHMQDSCSSLSGWAEIHPQGD